MAAVTSEAPLRLVAMSALAWGSRSLARQLAEERYLRSFVRASPVESQSQARDELVTLKRVLSSAIRFDVDRRDEPRPLLRSSAAETLESGYGFCGENARVAIVLLKMCGIRAHRLYLRGTGWGHVVVEHRWGDEWVMFDAHGDAGTMLADDAVGTISSEDLGRFPNEYREWNEYVRASRLKLLLRARPTPADGWRPPSALVTVVERPHLVKALAAFAFALTCLGVDRFLGERSR